MPLSNFGMVHSSRLFLWGSRPPSLRFRMSPLNIITGGGTTNDRAGVHFQMSVVMHGTMRFVTERELLGRQSAFSSSIESRFPRRGFWRCGLSRRFVSRISCRSRPLMYGSLQWLDSQEITNAIYPSQSRHRVLLRPGPCGVVANLPPHGSLDECCGKPYS